jgi:putative hemolysin
MARKGHIVSGRMVISMSNTKGRATWYAAGLLIGSALFACSDSTKNQGTGTGQDGPVAQDAAVPEDAARPGDGAAIAEDLNATDDRAAGAADPSFHYCEQGGGTVEVVYSTIGIASSAICQFADGTECDTWAYVRNECNPGDCTKWDTAANSCGRPSDAGTRADRPIFEPTSGLAGRDARAVGER